MKLIAAVLSLTFGLLIWALHLTLVYGVHTVACARDFTAVWFPGASFPVLAIVVITVLAMIAIAAGSWRFTRGAERGTAAAQQERQFEIKVIKWVAWLASIGVFWAGIAALIVSPCIALR
jgi:hypothetical protein